MELLLKIILIAIYVYEIKYYNKQRMKKRVLFFSGTLIILDLLSNRFYKWIYEYLIYV